MIDIGVLYFDWLVSRLDARDLGFERLCKMLHRCDFLRRVGHDRNRAEDGRKLREAFLDEHEEDIDEEDVDAFLARECSWLEMLTALSECLDFYYDEGVKEHFLELVDNLGLTSLIARASARYDGVDQNHVDSVCRRVDNNLIGPDGQSGLFPLRKKDHPDQREVEIWEQHAAYFREKLEGTLWTSSM